MKERSLVVFTLLSQMAAGSYWFLAALHALAATGAGVADADQLIQPALFPIFLCMLLGLFASIFHLGTICNAWRACVNLRASWLSREILFALLFTLGILALAMLPTSGPMLSAVRSGIAWMNLFFSLCMVWSMARIYRLRTVPAWNTPATTLSFFITAALMGSLSAAVLLSVGPGTAIGLRAPAVHLVAAFAAATMFLQIVWLIWQQRLERIALEGSPFDSATHQKGHHLQAALRLALTLASAALLALYFSASPESTLSHVALLGCFLTALTSEALGRILFYTARVHDHLC